MPTVLMLCLMALLRGEGPRFRAADIDALPAAAMQVDARGGHLVLELPLIQVPSRATIHTPVYRWTIPYDVCVDGFAVEVLDDVGHVLPGNRLHHVVLTDADRRDLFLPLAQPVFGASKESPRPVLPKYLIGMPEPAGAHYIAAAMLANPELLPRRMRVRIELAIVRPGRFLPLLRAYPWTMDVTYPLGGAGGRHDFDLPPGRSSRRWVGSPAIPGTILAMSGHAHDYATALELVDVTTGDTIWHGTPVLDARGRIQSVPIARFYRWYRLGIHIEPSHAYRISVTYDNPTGRTIPWGGMGSVMGLFIPDRHTIWPVLNPRDSVYRAQIHNLLENMNGMEMHEHAGAIAGTTPEARSSPSARLAVGSRQRQSLGSWNRPARAAIAAESSCAKSTSAGSGGSRTNAKTSIRRAAIASGNAGGPHRCPAS